MIAFKKSKFTLDIYELQMAHTFGFFDNSTIVRRNLEDSFLKSSKDFIN